MNEAYENLANIERQAELASRVDTLAKDIEALDEALKELQELAEDSTFSSPQNNCIKHESLSQGRY